MGPMPTDAARRYGGKTDSIVLLSVVTCALISIAFSIMTTLFKDKKFTGECDHSLIFCSLVQQHTHVMIFINGKP